MKLKLQPIFSSSVLIILTTALAVFLYFYYFDSKQLLQTPIDAWETDAIADCAVILTGGPGRVKEGLDLLIRHQVQRIIIAGVNPQVNLKDLYPQLALYPQINERNIVLERRSETTYGNAQQSLPIVEALQCQSLLLVTSYLHMKRAYKTFISTYPNEIKITPYSISGSDFPPHQWDIFMEVIKSWFYALWAY